MNVGLFERGTWRHSGITLIVLCTAFSPTRAVASPADANTTATTQTYKVQVVKDLPYVSGPDADKTRHRLDLYLPRGAKDFPVLFFVHGGCWMMGDKDFFGLHRPVGLYFARHGIGVVMTNYRLSPQVRHPVHVQDVARALAWTVKNIGKYHGRPDAIIALGHSAGGHLVALLGTDESYLKAQGLSFQSLKGIIACSGVYEIPPKNTFFDKVFGADPKARRQASPVANVHAGAPPFLLLSADHDLPFCGKPFAQKFRQALAAHKIPVEYHEIKNRTHNSLFLRAHLADDPVARAILAYVHAHTTEKSAQRTAN